MRKFVKKYYFSVEGETEKWYLIHLQKLINKNENAKYRVSFDCSVEKNPVKRVKSLVITNETEIYHLCDYESNEKIHVDQFKQTLSKLKVASNIGKNVIYRCGYSNLTFELWIILHKCDCYGSFTHRKHYIKEINRIFEVKLQDLSEYKNEKTFKELISKIEINDVISAIVRAKLIMAKNSENGYKEINFKGYKFYEKNPSLSIWESIEKILKECHLIDLSN